MTILQLIKRNKEIGLTDDPQFDKARKKYDWRNHLPDEIRGLWRELSVEARVIAFFMAERRACQEDWGDQ